MSTRKKRSPQHPLSYASHDAYIRARRYQVAVHEAGHAVVAHLTGTAIDHVKADGFSGYSMPLRCPASVNAHKLWAEANSISRKLVWGRLTDSFDGKEGWLLRKGTRRRHWKWNSRTDIIKPSSDGCGIVTTHGTRAPQELVDRVDDLRKQAGAIWKRVLARKGKNGRIKELMHTLGGPVADNVFFDIPFAPPRSRRLTRAEKEARGLPDHVCVGEDVGNLGAAGDFRHIRQHLKHIDNANWKEAREFYRLKAEKLVRQHRATIERVARALMRRKTLTGAEVAKLID